LANESGNKSLSEITKMQLGLEIVRYEPSSIKESPSQNKIPDLKREGESPTPSLSKLDGAYNSPTKEIPAPDSSINHFLPLVKAKSN
jgi:hypothetical protein